MKRRSLTSDGLTPYAFLAPLLVLLGAFILYPVAMNLSASFTDWKGYGPQKWVGLKNYATMLADQSFWTSLRNTAVFLVYVPIGTVATVLVAAVLREGIAGWQLYRAVLYVPNLLGYVIMGVIFSVYLRDEGALNQVLVFLGGSPLHFLIDPTLAINAVGFLLVVWLHLGFGIIYFLAAMNSIDKSIYEAALVDGVGFWGTFRHVTLPGVRFAIEFFIVFNFIEVFARMFPFIYTLTQGGPGYSTFTLEYGIFAQGFQRFKVGYSSAWAVVLFGFCAIISILQIRTMRKRETA